jgi:TRAP-type C4-dicarboxylate transport system permease small subunit
MGRRLHGAAMTAGPTIPNIEGAGQNFGGQALPSWSRQSYCSRICEVTSAGFFVAMIVSILAGILFRQIDFGYGQAMQWSVALANIALIWSIFLGTGLVDVEKSHIRVDFIYERLGKKGQAFVNMIGNVLFAVTFVLVIPGAVRFAEAAGARTLVGTGITYRDIFSIFIFWLAITALNQVFDFHRNWQTIRKGHASGNGAR